MRYLQAFVHEYKKQFVHNAEIEAGMAGEIKSVQRSLLDEKFHPSVQLKTLFDKLLRRSKYPMEVAIVGQFSSGKSTFLNALLSKDILPTGITPVTSKVNYINYADEYKLKVTYKSGAEEYHVLDAISQFTDQRELVEDIKYLTLYAPMDILHDISFVDTPGLNSQSFEDTQSTKKILRDVDGIIWLTLIDNAGKESEAEVLSEYLENFKEKSLCVLNQKDRVSKEQMQLTLEYITTRFSDFFCKVVPISAKQALESRVHQKEILIENALFEMQNSFRQLSEKHIKESDLGFFKKPYEDFQIKIKRINAHDNTENVSLMHESNISQVLEFIENTLRPQAKESKAYALRNDLRSICEILSDEYMSILGVYESLEKILRHKEEEIMQAFDQVYLKHAPLLYTTYDKLDTVLEAIAQSIYENIRTDERSRYEESRGVFGQRKVKISLFEALFVDQEAVMQKLFYEDRYVDKQIKAAVEYFKTGQNDTAEDLYDVFMVLKRAIQVWQEPYEQISKHREIASDLEFANTRQFVAKVYENILSSYHSAVLEDISDLHRQSAFLEGKVNASYKQLCQESICILQQKIDRQRDMHIKEPLKYAVNMPDYETVLEVVRHSYELEKTDQFLRSRRNYLYKTIESAKEKFEVINKEKIDYILTHKHAVSNKIDAIKMIASSIVSR